MQRTGGEAILSIVSRHAPAADRHYVSRRMTVATFALGGTARERVEVAVLGYERAPAGEYHDDNWLRVRITVQAGAFSGSYDAAFLTEEIIQFRKQLEVMYESLRGEAEFTTLEEQLSLRLTANGRGEVLLRGTAVDTAGTGNRLEFQLTLDQTHLHRTVDELRQVTDRYPIRAG